MSELKVNIINPAAGNNVQFPNSSQVVIGNTGSATSLIISSATGESISVNSNFKIYTTDGNIKSTYGYKSNGTTENLGTLTDNDLAFLTNNRTRMTIKNTGDVVIPAIPGGTGNGRLGVGMSPAITGQMISTSYGWNGISRISVYNSSNTNNASAFFHANNNTSNALFGLYGITHSSFPSTLSIEADTGVTGGVRISAANPSAGINFYTGGTFKARLDEAGGLGIGNALTTNQAIGRQFLITDSSPTITLSSTQYSSGVYLNSYSAGGGIQMNTNTDTIYGGSNALSLWNMNGPITFYCTTPAGTDPQETLRIHGSNIGVGNFTQTPPKDILQVSAPFGPTGFGVYSSHNLLYNGHFGATSGNIAAYIGNDMGVAAIDGWTPSDFGFGTSATASIQTITDGNRGTEQVIRCQNGGGVYQDVSVVPGAVYTLSAKMRVGATGGAGDASVGHLTVGTTTNATSIVDKRFDLNNYDTGAFVGDFIYCSETFTAPAASTKLTTIRVGVRSAGSTHLIQATDIGLYKGGIAKEFTPIQVKPNSKDVFITGKVGIGTQSVHSNHTLDVYGSIRCGTVISQNTNGYVFIAPQNSSYSHFQTDRPAYYFNKGIDVDTGQIKAYYGTYNPPLTLWAGGQERLRIDGTAGDVTIPSGGGRLGVGMNPAVEGQVISGSYTWNGVTRISVYNSSVGTSAMAAYHLNNNFCNGYVGIYGTGNNNYKNAVSLEADSLANGGVFLYAGNTTAPIRFINSGGERMRIDSTGNLGIGSTNPTSKLHFGNYYINSAGPTSDEQTSHIRLYDNTTGTVYGLGVSTAALNIAANQSGGTIRLYTNSVERMRITDTGISAGAAPTDGSHLANKTYVDSITRVGSTLTFSMLYGTAYSNQWHGVSKTASSKSITLPTGTWNGYAWSVPAAGTPVIMTFITNASGLTALNGPATPAAGDYFNVNIVRTA